jgi:hypothetical protein
MVELPPLFIHFRATFQHLSALFNHLNMPVAELTLQELTCHKGNEKTDEVYFIVKIEYDNRSDVVMDRYPSGKPEHIQMNAGDTIRDLQLYIGEGGPLTLTIHFKEQDASGLLSAMTGMDDTLGVLVLKSKPGEGLAASPEKTAKVVAVDGHVLRFELNGANAHYSGQLTLTNK